MVASAASICSLRKASRRNGSASDTSTSRSTRSTSGKARGGKGDSSESHEMPDMAALQAPSQQQRRAKPMPPTPSLATAAVMLLHGGNELAQRAAPRRRFWSPRCSREQESHRLPPPCRHQLTQRGATFCPPQSKTNMPGPGKAEPNSGGYTRSRKK